MEVSESEKTDLELASWPQDAETFSTAQNWSRVFADTSWSNRGSSFGEMPGDLINASSVIWV